MGAASALAQVVQCTTWALDTDGKVGGIHHARCKPKPVPVGSRPWALDRGRGNAAPTLGGCAMLPVILITRTERAYLLERAARDLHYAGKQLEKAAEQMRLGNELAAQDCVSRACEGTDRVCKLFTPVDAELA